MEQIKILLADDDEDDCAFFQEVLNEIEINTALTVVTNGEALIRYLGNNPLQLPHVIFLDLNMPLRTGVECLAEIQKFENLKNLPVIIYSTSANPDVIDLLYTKGARYYIRKPADYLHLKSVINKALWMLLDNKACQPAKEAFVVQP